MNTGPERQQAEGYWDKLKGSVKEGVGDVFDDAKLQAEGLADQAAGEAKIQAGKAREALHDAIEDGSDSQKAAGIWDRVAGKVKEEWGDLTDNERLEAEGKAQQAFGKAQQASSEVRDDLADRV